ncbi:MAG: dTMP kinase, partial [Elusimicrobia bacterium]|nr:dTMP kinase [Elusimicrobiota bacterium]
VPAHPRLSRVTGMPGRLIVVEGLDGSGKSTQLEMLRESLEAQGAKVVTTRWNSSELVSEAVKKAKRERTLTPASFAALNAADLSDRLENVILPALREGSIVLSDRYFYTALARDSVRGNDPLWLRRLYDSVLRPDLTFYFRLPVETAIGRVLARTEDRLKLSEDFAEDGPRATVLGQNYYAAGRDMSFAQDDAENFRIFQSRVADSYDRQAEEFGFEILDARQDRESLRRQVSERAGKVLGPLEAYKRKDAPAQGANLFDKDPAGDAPNIQENYKHAKRGVHFYFRNMLLPMQERFAQLMDLSAMPQAFLHGSPHVDNYAKSARGAAMVDFDRSRLGPYAWD